MSPTPATRLIALLGDPVGHSLSPAFQNAAFAAAGADGVYLALRCSAESVPGLMRGISEAGGGGNVTLPHKEIAAQVVDLPTDAVLRTGACNTWWRDGDTLCGDNTDVAGFAAAARTLLGAAPAGARVLLVGAGGAARATLCALLDEGAGEVVLLNRTRDRAEALRRVFPEHAARLRIAGAPAELQGESFDLAVNATTLGLRPADPLPLPLDTGPRFAAALDLVYRPDRTAWVRALRERGLPAEDGLEMLIEQGAAAFRRWWGVSPPLDAMRAALPSRG